MRGLRNTCSVLELIALAEVLSLRVFSVIAFVALVKNGAEKRSRTVDLFITNELLYQLSYFGVPYLLS